MARTREYGDGRKQEDGSWSDVGAYGRGFRKCPNLAPMNAIWVTHVIF
jgi:hypothetical protein